MLEAMLTIMVTRSFSEAPKWSNGILWYFVIDFILTVVCMDIVHAVFCYFQYISPLQLKLLFQFVMLCISVFLQARRCSRVFKFCHE